MILQRVQSPTSNKLYFLVIILVLSGVLLYNLFNLQIVKGRQYFFDSKNSSSYERIVRANRGIIYDRNGVKLVENLTKYNLNLLKKENTTEEKFAQTIESLKKIYGQDIEAKYNEGYEKVKDYKNIPYVKLFSKEEYHPKVFEIEANRDKFPALEIDQTVVRHYLYPELTSHILGYTSEINAEEYATGKYDFGDEIGKAGLENGYDDILRGQNGIQRIDYYGAENKNVQSTVQERKNGQDIYLTIDLSYQQKIYELIKNANENVGELKDATAFGVVLEDVKTGNILAMASYPNYDANLFVNGISTEDYKKYEDNPGKPMLNKATQYAQSPGSTFKLLTDMVALQEGIIDPNRRIYTGGTWDYNGTIFEDYAQRNWGDINVLDAICVSSNIFHMKSMLELDEKTGGKAADKMNKVFSDIGMDKYSGLRIGTEQAADFPTPSRFAEIGEPWYPGYLLNASIGQGDVRVNPLQLVNMVSTVANKGEVKKQKIVLDRNNPNAFESKKIEVDERHFNTINEGMKCATGRNNFVLPQNELDMYPETSEKTGTAQSGMFENGEEIINGWQVTFTPSNDPELAMSVFMENGKQGYNGGYISKEFYRYWWNEVKNKN